MKSQFIKYMARPATYGGKKRKIPYGKMALSLASAAASRYYKKAAKKPYGKPYKRYTKYKRSTTNVKKLAKRVDKLARGVKSGQGELIYHALSTGTLRAAIKVQNYVLAAPMSCSTYESVLGELRFFDSATPNTLVQASGASATYTREYYFKTCYTSVEVRNNYQVPCKLTAYVVCPKKDTSIEALTAFTDGLADVGNPSNTSPCLHLTDSQVFNDLWRICKTTKRELLPGKSCTITHSTGEFGYDPAIFDSHALTYQSRFKTYAVLLRVEGVIGHDTSAAEYGMLAAGIDYKAHRKVVVHYDAGADIKYIFVSDGQTGFTNAGVVSSMPVSDNLSYSVA